MSAASRDRVELAGWAVCRHRGLWEESCRDDWSQWLRRQTSRPDRVGAFARLAGWDPDFPRVPWQVLRHLQERRADHATVLAAAQAVREHLAHVERALLDDLERARDRAVAAVASTRECLAEAAPGAVPRAAVVGVRSLGATPR
jgi:hypothetical protein